MSAARHIARQQSSVDEDHIYAPLEAAQLAKQTSTTKLRRHRSKVAMRLGVDPRKADQMVARHRQPATWHRQDRQVSFSRRRQGREPRRGR